MKKLFLCFFLLNFIIITSDAQNLFFDWAKSSGASNDDVAQSNVVDKNGNSYIAGYFTGRVDFNPGTDTFYLSSNGDKDIFIFKLDKKGDFVWAKSIGGKANDKVNSIVSDTFGNIFITGYFESRVDFDPDTSSRYLQSTGGSDAFIAKLNSRGNLKWVNSIGGKHEESGNGITIHSNGTIYFTGIFQDSVYYTYGTSGKSILISKGKNDIFVARCDTGGNYTWIKSMGGASDDVSFSISCDRNENAVTTGYFYDKCNFGTGSTSYILASFGSSDAFVSKLDGKGNYLFAFQLGGTGEDVGKSVKIDGSSNIISTGWFSGTADFNPSKATAFLYSNGKSDIYISKLNSTGAYSWAKQIGGTEDDKGNSLSIDANADIFTTGFYQSKVDFDPSTSVYYNTSKGKEDVYISKLNSSGSFLWAKSFGGHNTDVGNDIFVNTDKSVYTSGYFSDTSDFNPSSDSFNIISNGGTEAFIHKMMVCSNSYSSVTASNCYSYTFNGETFTSSGTYYQKMPTKKGCDSIITLNLTIYTTTIENLNVVACKSYTLNGTTYTQPGTYYQTIKNSNGCDSIIVLSLSFGESSGNISAISCDKYILNGTTFSNSGTYKQTIKNHLGCDSFITLKLTIKKSTSSNVNITACNSYNIKNTTYTKSGTYTQTIKNMSDCDSFITLNLTINKSTDTVINAEACNNYKLNSVTYDQSGTYKQIIKNRKNCDSTITLNLKLNNNSSIANINACRSFTIGGNTYTKNGTYDVVIPNSKGCDSLISLNLSINDIDNSVTVDGRVISANQKDAQYQWLDCKNNFSPISGAVYKDILVKTSGKYAVQVSKDVCIDTSECVLIDFDAISKVDFNAIKVIPNPASDVLYIEFTSNLGMGTLKIYNNISQVVLQKNNLETDKIKLDISTLKKGIYYIELINNSVTIRSSFVKI